MKILNDFAKAGLIEYVGDGLFIVTDKTRKLLLKELNTQIKKEYENVWQKAIIFTVKRVFELNDKDKILEYALTLDRIIKEDLKETEVIEAINVLSDGEDEEVYVKLVGDVNVML